MTASRPKGPAGRKRLGRMMSMLAVAVPIFGPVVGGVLVSGFGWRWVFYVNPPICLAAMWLAWLYRSKIRRGL